MPPAPSGARSDPLRRGVEGGAPQPAQVSFVWTCRPDRQHPVHAKRLVTPANAAVTVESLVRFVDEGLRAIVDVEENGIESVSRLADAVEHISNRHLDPLVVQRVTSEIADSFAIPAHESG